MLSPDQFYTKVFNAKSLWLFLDYDGTLVDFAPTPDIVEPQPAVIELLTKVANHPRIRLAIISGRRLEDLEKLLPIPGAILAGTYGIELRAERDERIERIPYEDIRPTLEKLKSVWEPLVLKGDRFFLEDKGWALAIHARFVEDAKAKEVIAKARKMAEHFVDPRSFRILGGHKFLEVAPLEAHKGTTVEYILQRYQRENALPLYMGDDDKDEEAFETIKSRGGIPILVASIPRKSGACYRLDSPKAVHRYLELIMSKVKNKSLP
ncbi:MAG: trehalose-phosphatase [Anaerolineales bacterium]|nr:trehalose-phosphatase [Anaerolineales bacterium]